jgi:MHS family proline/betaine transporter-like MFS transporter
MKRTQRTVAAGAIGNALEWYDFAVYGYFAASIGRTFFAPQEPLSQMLLAFGVFAVGYLMRPLGGLVIGHIGDRYGRSTALTVSIMAMAVPTFLIGLLPGYAAIGMWAPVLLTLLRMVQGLAVGGEYTTSLVFMVEHAPPGRRGLVGALACCGAVAGMLLGSGTGALLASVMPDAALQAWGWRIPFLLGLLVGVAGWLLRRHLEVEAPAAAHAAGQSPLVQTWREYRGLVSRLAALSTFNAVGFYLLFVYIVSWMELTDHIAPGTALRINTISMAVLLLCIAGMGWLSDRIGRRRVLLFSTGAGVVAAYPLLWVMAHPDPAVMLCGQLVLAVILGAFLGAQPAAMVEAVPARIRCTAIALGYNLCVGIVGGLTPLAATWLVTRTHDDLAPAFLVAGAGLVSFLATLGLKDGDAAGKPLPIPGANAGQNVT